MDGGQRLDVALVARGLVPSRERAQAAIAAGLVRINGAAAGKAAQRVAAADIVAVLGDPVGYVGRGGQKLAAALDHWHLDPAGLVCLDVGASTGGFTDCLLGRGARRVYAVDVGHGQLDRALAADARVVNLEGTDIRRLAALPEPADAAVVDVAFISLTLVLLHVLRLLRPGGWIVALVKPQFEVGRAGVGKGGVVRDPARREQALASVQAAAFSLGLAGGEAIPSPLRGGDGNQEFLIVLGKPG